ncbi:MAG: YkgJ family cysteine cluster protein, partial [Methanomicrobiales archaeon]|nr:YkgJ family cysteine cluster protein [Methanomicrobiales archaeon]
DAARSCLFLEDGRCRIYHDRPMVCRVYPYMLHREPDGEGIIDWRQISGLDEHGCYHTEISREESFRIARETRAFEEALLCHEMAFLEFTGDYFSRHGLRHVRKVYDDRMREFKRGAEVRVMVYSQGCFEPWEVRPDQAERLPE